MECTRQSNRFDIPTLNCTVLWERKTRILINFHLTSIRPYESDGIASLLSQRECSMGAHSSMSFGRTLKAFCMRFGATMKYRTFFSPMLLYMLSTALSDKNAHKKERNKSIFIKLYPGAVNFVECLCPRLSTFYAGNPYVYPTHVNMRYHTLAGRK